MRLFLVPVTIKLEIILHHR